MGDADRDNGRVARDGYFRQPTVFTDGADGQEGQQVQGRVVFVSEDDLWEVPLEGGRARRLTSGKGASSRPAFSPDGEMLAFTGTEEGATEVFVMDSRGGPVEQLTYNGSSSSVVGWTPDGEYVVFRSTYREAFRRAASLYKVPVGGGPVERMPLGHAHSIDWGDGGEDGGQGRVLGRHSDDLARWKRYRGGTAGTLWVDVEGSGDWSQLLADETAGLVNPMWLDGRIYFVSDFEGWGNIYSCRPDGSDLDRHTHHDDFYARFAQADPNGGAIVYACGARLWRLEPGGHAPEPIEVDYGSPRTPRNRKFVDAQDYLEEYTLDPTGAEMAVTTRGKLFDFGLWEGAARQHGEANGVRYRLQRYLDEDRVLVLSDEGGEEHFEVHHLSGEEEPRRIDTGDFEIGRPLEVKVSPKFDDGDEAVAFTNHRNELVHLEVDTGTVQLIDSSEHFRMAGFDWSPDANWLAYGFHESWQTARIKIAEVGGEWATHEVTSGRYRDSEPIFDPEGRYLYFLSCRDFDPVYDQLFFELSFPQAMKPCVVTLTEEEDSIFHEEPRPVSGAGGAKGEDDDEGDEENGEEAENGEEKDEQKGDGEEKGDDEEGTDEERVEIDFEGINGRVESFPVRTADYEGLQATDKRVFWTVRGFEDRDESGFKPHGGGATLEYFSLKKRDTKTFAEGVLGFEIGPDGATMTLEASNGRLQVIDATGKGPAQSSNGGGEASRESGWLDLGRLAVSVEPIEEWRQMLREAWRLMRDNFWRRDMTGVDWQAVWERYSSLLGRVSARTEFSDLVWTMHGELGTSHAYEMGGDYPERPQYRPGFLGIDFEWSDEADWEHRGRAETGGFLITHIVQGATWEERAASPLARPGVDVREGDVIVAINGTPVREDQSLQELLVHKAGEEVDVTVWRAPEGEDSEDSEEKATRTETVELLRTERKARYWEWVEQNRQRVHEATDGEVGYVHIPDMGPHGFAEFHRSFLSEQNRDALVVDVRYNGGGHVSQLILEKLSRQRIGWDVPRWGQASSYPEGAIDGPIVALTNEFAGSDGDIFSHCFKLMGIGPLLGKRTWGGVIGIWPRHRLVDGSVTTQPEFASWFKDVGFNLENYGTEPNQVVDDPPGSMVGEADPQLDAAIERVRTMLAENPVERPEFDSYLDMAPPDELPDWNGGQGGEQ